MEHQCIICPHEADLDKPPPINVENAPRIQFFCGHSVHTQCMIAKYYEYDRQINDCTDFNRAHCPECDSPLTSPEFNEWLNRKFRNRENRFINIENLWTTNEVFREDVKELSKVGRELTAGFNAHDKDIATLRREFKEVIKGSVTFIKSQSEVFNKRLVALPSRKKSTRASVKYNKCMKKLLDTYDLSQYEMRFFKHAKNTPKIPITYRHASHHRIGRYIFRVRI